MYHRLFSSRPSLPLLASFVLAAFLILAPAGWSIGGMQIAGPDKAYGSSTPVRLAGANRFETMQKVVNKGFKSADTVVIATGEKFPDALTASGIAGINDAPIM